MMQPQEQQQPMMQYLPTGVQQSARYIGRTFSSWVSAWETWRMQIGEVDVRLNASKSRGRRTYFKWKKVWIGQSIKTPIAWLAAPPDMQAAERAATVLLELVDRIIQSPDSPVYCTALGHVITDESDTMVELARTIGARSFGRLLKELTSLWHFLMHQAAEMPRKVRARAEAVLKKVQATRKNWKERSRTDVAGQNFRKARVIGA